MIWIRVLTRYGGQEGSQLGYNPWRRGKKSHHPLMAFAAECRMVVTAWLRPGNACDSNNVENFFREVLAVFGSRHRIGLLRCDCGFCIGKFMDLVESKAIFYIIPVRLLSTIRRQISGLKDWVELDEVSSVAEFMYQAHTRPPVPAAGSNYATSCRTAPSSPSAAPTATPWSPSSKRSPLLMPSPAWTERTRVTEST